MKQTFTLLLLILGSLNIISAQIEQVSVGESYTEQAYFNLATGETTTVVNDSWDLAFSVFGFQDAGIFVNEATGVMGIELQLFEAPTSDFDVVFFENDLGQRLLNDELSWAGGAFNFGKDPTDFTDFGWGLYNPQTMSVVGTKIFVLKLRDGSYKKIFIEGLNVTTYNVRYADLDGSNEGSFSIDKMQFQGKQFAYFSFTDNEVKDLEPTEWDFLFTRYNSPVPDGEGAILDYLVTGVLTAEGVQVAEAAGVDPSSVEFDDYEAMLSPQIDIIGFDWKDIDINTIQWAVYEDRAYFVKRENGDIYKITFLDFEGSSTGVSTFESVFVTSTSNDNLNIPGFSLSNIYPNPSSGAFNIDINNDSNSVNANIKIYDRLGRVIFKTQESVYSGANTLDYNIDVPANDYYFTIEVDGRIMAQKLIIK